MHTQLHATINNSLCLMKQIYCTLLICFLPENFNIFLQFSRKSPKCPLTRGFLSSCLCLLLCLLELQCPAHPNLFYDHHNTVLYPSNKGIINYVYVNKISYIYLTALIRNSCNLFCSRKLINNVSRCYRTKQNNFKHA
jgi:hypothetical protein